MIDLPQKKIQSVSVLAKQSIRQNKQLKKKDKKKYDKQRDHKRILEHAKTKIGQLNLNYQSQLGNKAIQKLFQCELLYESVYQSDWRKSQILPKNQALFKNNRHKNYLKKAQLQQKSLGTQGDLLIRIQRSQNDFQKTEKFIQKYLSSNQNLRSLPSSQGKKYKNYKNIFDKEVKQADRVPFEFKETDAQNFLQRFCIQQPFKQKKLLRTKKPNSLRYSKQTLSSLSIQMQSTNQYSRSSVLSQCKKKCEPYRMQKTFNNNKLIGINSFRQQDKAKVIQKKQIKINSDNFDWLKKFQNKKIAKRVHKNLYSICNSIQKQNSYCMRLISQREKR